MTQIVSISELTVDHVPVDPTQSNRKSTEGTKSGAVDSSAFRRGAITIGNFDGVHRGHAQLLREVRRMADRVEGPAVAITFDPHPAAILRPETAPVPLTTMQQRAERMNEIGIDGLVVCQTSPELLNLSADQFYQALVRDRLDALGMVEGPNFFFGRGRKGNVERLSEVTDRDGIEFLVVQPTKQDDQMVSSSLIRGCLADGDVREAALLCGHPHQIRAAVGHGEKRGQKLGFPTANLVGIEVVVPKIGVYAAQVIVGDEKFDAAVHIGPNPTFQTDPTVKVEVHLLGYAGDLYDQTITVDFVDRIRDVARFESAESLKRQLVRDVQEVRKLLANDSDT